MDYKKLTLPYKDIMVSTLKEWVAIDSVFDESTVSEENPFGKGVSNALTYIAEVAKKDGFKVTNYDNKVVEIIIGEGPKNITIMGHADVVPTGEGWPSDPFIVVEDGDELIARGVADDKGPTLASYYALKALKDNNLLGNYQVRLLVGGNEETGSECMNHYFNTLKKPQPTVGFSPDSAFPIIYGEKAHLPFKASMSVNVDGLSSLKGGIAFNAVIDKCVFNYKKDENFKKFVLSKEKDALVTPFDNYDEYVINGVAAHGSVPWMGVNAGLKAVNLLAEYLNNADLKKFLSYFSDPKGNGCDAADEDPDFRNNSLNVGYIDYSDNKLSIVVDFRFGNMRTGKQLKDAITKKCEGVDLTFFGEGSKPLFFSKDSVLISTLVNAYQEESGDYKSQPIATGGGTYAQSADNVVAFGLEIPGVDPKMHGVGEHISKEHLCLGMAVYARAILALGKQIDEGKI